MRPTLAPRKRLSSSLPGGANRNPLAIADAEFQVLRQAGAQDTEIVEALGVMEVFTAFNKFLDSLQVEIDF